MKNKVIIIEDEAHIRDGIIALLKTHNDVEVTGYAASVNDAVTLIDQMSPDIVLLDVHLEDGSGFDVVSQVKYRQFGLVFITAYDQYAIRAIKYNALDYLLKPIEVEEFNVAIKKAIQNSEQIRQLVLEDTPSQITLSTSDGKFFVKLDDIVRCEANGGYTTFYLVEGKHYMVSKPLKYFDTLLPEPNFIRVHQSHLINKNFVQRYTSVSVFLANCEKEIPVSSRKRARVKQLLDY